MKEQISISVVIPAYNESEIIEKTSDKISELLSQEHISFELVFVDDGSTDSTWQKILYAYKNSINIKGIHFSRNFGKEAAIIAGLSQSAGDCCAVIDCDLQHPPHKLIEMYYLWQQGYEIIEGRKTNRGNEEKLHTFAAKIFYNILSSVTGIDMANASDFKLLDRKAVNVLINMHEKNSFFRALSSWIGFKTTSIEFVVEEREAGESKWSTKSLVKYALNNITSFSTAPMQIVTALGVLMFVLSLLLGCISIGQKVMGTALGGYTTVILIQLFSSSILMISLGIIGYYIAKVYEEIKGRPPYIISDVCGKTYDEQDG